MKTNILLFFLLLSQGIYSQNHDYNWVMGYGSNPDNLDYGGTNINFGKTPAEVKYVYRDINISFNTTSMSDSSGNLLFYTNGCVIADAEDQIIENGNGINPGHKHDVQCDYGYPMTQGSLILPDPKSNDSYYYFHKPFMFIRRPLLDAVSPVFYKTRIEIDSISEKLSVVEKNVSFLQDTVIWGELTAVKHANGRDWWVVTPKYPEPAYVVTLLDSAGIHLQDYQFIGLETPRNGQGSCNAVFSPDGKTYARFNSQTQLFLFDFDRNTGMLSNFRNIQVAPVDKSGAAGLAFSPDSKLLYFSMGDFVYQFDMQANNIGASKLIVATYDGFIDFSATRFNSATLGPDCRIYLTSLGSSKYLHVIEHPNIRGDGCEVRQHSFQLPTYNNRSLPFHPNYRLGPLGNEGYPCDSTLVATAQPIIRIPKVGVSPNPTSDILNIEIIDSRMNYDFSLFSVTGQKVLEQSNIHSDESFNISHLHSGIYFWSISHHGRILESGKVIIQ